MPNQFALVMTPETPAPESEELRLQRFVDDEMSHEEERDFLRVAEKQPSVWREVALAFVEDRRWRRELESYGAQDSESPPAAAVPLRPLRVRFTAVAALLAISGAVFGYWLGGQASRWVPSDAPSLQAASETGAAGDGDAERKAGGYRLRLLAGLPEGDARTLELPVATPEEVFERLAHSERATKQFDLPPEWKARGYTADWRTGLVTGDLGDGRQLLVPVGLPSVRYRGQ